MNNTFLRSQIVTLLQGKGAHMSFGEAVVDFPQEHINSFPPNVPYTPWAILEHIRITQKDMLNYIKAQTPKEYAEIPWPDAYWPAKDKKANKKAWKKTIASFQKDNEELQSIVSDPKTDLFAPIGANPKHTILRCMRIVGDHNAYHIGEFAILRQVMNTW